MHYLIFGIMAGFSVLLINESWIVGVIMEKLFRMEPDSFYDKSRKHATLVGVFKWPFLLALIGLVVPTAWSLDFLVTFAIGLIIGWKDFWRTESKRLPAPDIVVVRESEEV